MNNKLNIISSDIDNTEGRISIIDNGEQSNLAYIKEGKVTNITGESSRFRPTLMSELSNKLSARDWNITERKFIFTGEGDFSGELALKISQPSDPIDIIDTALVESGNRVIAMIISDSNKRVGEEAKKSFEEEYSNILSNMDMKEIYLYNSSKNIVDILTNSVILDIIQYNSDVYTNTLSLSQFIEKAAYSGISGKVELGVQYSMKNGIVKSYSTTFEGFKYTNSGNSLKLNMDNFVEEINSEVTIEYISGTIRLIPTSSNVNECIISNCQLTYGNIG